MVATTFKFQKGAISLRDDDHVSSVSKDAAKPSWLVVALYALTALFSVTGLFAMGWAFFLIDTYNWGPERWPFPHRVFVDQYIIVAVLVRGLHSF
jgi:hypothetical protein